MASFETPRPRRRTRAPDPLVFTAPSMLQRFADDDEVEAGLDLLLQDPRRWHPALKDRAYQDYVTRQFERVYGDGKTPKDPETPRAGPKPINRTIEPFPAPDPDAVARAAGGAPIELGGLAARRSAPERRPAPRPPRPVALMERSAMREAAGPGVTAPTAGSGAARGLAGAGRPRPHDPPSGNRRHQPRFGETGQKGSRQQGTPSWGEPVRISLRRFQEEAGLEPTGRLDPKTQELLDRTPRAPGLDFWMESGGNDGPVLAWTGPLAQAILRGLGPGLFGIGAAHEAGRHMTGIGEDVVGAPDVPVPDSDVVGGPSPDDVQPNEDLPNLLDDIDFDGLNDIPEVSLPENRPTLDDVLPGWRGLQNGDVFVPPWGNGPDFDPPGTWAEIQPPPTSLTEAAFPSAGGRPGTLPTQWLNWSLNRCVEEAAENIGLPPPALFGGRDQDGVWHAERRLRPRDSQGNPIEGTLSGGSFLDAWAHWDNFAVGYGFADQEPLGPRGRFGIGGNSQTTLVDGVTPNSTERRQEVRTFRNLSPEYPTYIYTRIPKGRTINHERCVEFMEVVLRGALRGDGSHSIPYPPFLE